jgi:iron complex outermembrane receptor protein
VNGLYAQDFITISSKLKALAGLRLDFYQTGYQTAEVKTARNLIKHSEETTIYETALSYRLGLVYEPVKSLSLYSSYSNFYRPRRIVYYDTRVYINKNGKEFFPTKGDEKFKPEKGYQIEVGLKYNYQSKLNVNASAYYILQENIVESLGKTVDDERIYGQVGMVDSKGFDIEAIIMPIEGLKLTTGYGFNIAKYRKFSGNEYINSNKGNYVTRNPKNHFFAWAFYQVPAGWAKNINVGLGVDYTDRMYTNSANTYKLPEYMLFNTAIGYSLDKTYFKLKLNNVFDKKYYNNYVFPNQYIPGYGQNAMFTVGVKL